MHTPSASESCIVLLFIVGVTLGGGFATSALTMADTGDDWLVISICELPKPRI